MPPPINWQRPSYLSGWMQVALAEAEKASALGDVPVGALLVDERGDLLGAGYNRREIDHDPTAHAEVLALRAATRRLGRWRLPGCTLICTLEPCLMCAGALIQSRVARVVYAADDPKAGAVRSLFATLEDPRLNHRIEVIRGVEAEASGQQLRAFFAALRAQGQK
jgi:tRNA(adenine34) deaminase